MSNFFEYDVPNSLVDYKILVYPNITFHKALEKDSFIVVLSNTIRELNKVRNDLHFTVLVPYKTPSLEFDNVDQVIMPVPTYPPIMRTHFDFFTFNKLFDWNNTDFDIVYSHLPEHTTNLASFFNNYTNIAPKIIGYCHWYEIKENSSYEHTMFLDNIAGTLKMDQCGVNSNWLKDLIISRAKKYYSTEVIDKLKHIIQPHRLGIDTINTESSNYEKNTILFNHRDGGYTGWTWFVKQMDELWKQRQDFKVYTTLIKLDKPWLHKKTLNSRQEYLDFVKSCYIGVGTFQKYSAWSISTTDGLSQGVPYLLPNDLVYPEMVGKNYPMLYDGEAGFKTKLNELLDSPKLRDDTNEYMKPLLPSFTWDGRVLDWFDNWDIFELPEGQKNDTYNKLVDFIKKHGEVTKKDLINFLGWGRSFAFTKHRNSLRSHPNIQLTNTTYQWIK